MGKKKSVVLMTLITIVLLVLCAVVAFPRVVLPGTNGIKKWNPVAMQYDLGTEFGGGHYAYYYPQGVITENEYNDNLLAYHGFAEEDEYRDSYVQHGGLYLSKDPEDCVLEDGKVTEGFKTAFNEALEIITERFAERAKYTGSTYRVSVVDDYAIRVELSATENTDAQGSETYALQAFSQFAKLDELSFEITTSESSEKVEQLSGDVTVKDLIKKVSAKNRYEVSYLKITFTDLGKEMLESFKNAEGATSLDFKLGDESLMQITSENITDKNEVEFGVSNQSDSLYAQTLCILINSAMENGKVNINDKAETPFVLVAPTQASEMATFEPVYGDLLVWIYVAILVLLVAALALAIVKMGGFGVMNAYASVTYLVLVGICYAFISPGVFAVSMSSILVFLAGLALVNVLHVYIYQAIKGEVALGKTVQSSVKNGYKKTIWTVIDIYAVLCLGAIALLLGVAALPTLACQALVCIGAGAFCTLLWGRVINLMLLSASKDKYKYFHFVREEDDDDE